MADKQQLCSLTKLLRLYSLFLQSISLKYSFWPVISDGPLWRMTISSIFLNFVNLQGFITDDCIWSSQQYLNAWLFELGFWRLYWHNHLLTIRSLPCPPREVSWLLHLKSHIMDPCQRCQQPKSVYSSKILK